MYVDYKQPEFGKHCFLMVGLQSGARFGFVLGKFQTLFVCKGGPAEGKDGIKVKAREQECELEAHRTWRRG